MKREGFHGRAGFGSRPALIVVDVNVGFTDPRSPLVCELDQVVVAIARLLEDESGGVRVTAAAVLGKFEDPRAVPALVRSLGDAQWDVRQASATALGQIGDRRAIPALEKATRDSRKSVARAAAAALRAM